MMVVCLLFFSFFAGWLIIASIQGPARRIGEAGVQSPFRPLRGLSGGLGDPDDPGVPARIMEDLEVEYSGI
jgi:hypothetical protein